MADPESDPDSEKPIPDLGINRLCFLMWIRLHHFFLKMSDLVSLLHGSGSATPFRRSGKVFSVFLENGLLCHSRVFFGKPAEYVNCGSETHPSVVFF